MAEKKKRQYTEEQKKKYSDLQKKKYLEQKASKPEGVCAQPYCNNPIEDAKYKVCLSCREHNREAVKKYRKVPKPEGICSVSGCKNQARPGLAHCEDCAAKQAVYGKKPINRKKGQERNRRLRDEVFNAYGGRCCCCGESNFAFLSIDHENGFDGTGPRKGDHLYGWLKAQGFPSGFRVLCMNCNCSLGHRGYCPHGNLTQAVKPKTLSPTEQTLARREYQKDRHIELRKKVFEVYGGAVCTCCGETIFEFLTIDHLEGTGAEHRREDRGARDLCAWIVSRGFPPGFQVLCMNCNAAKGRHNSGGKCPHEKAREVLLEKVE